MINLKYKTMASVKVKFRASTADCRNGILYYQVIHNRVVRQISTEYRVCKDEWNQRLEKIMTDGCGAERAERLRYIQKRVKYDKTVLNKIIISLSGRDTDFTSDDVVAEFAESPKELLLSDFMSDIISQLQRLGRLRTAETYFSALSSFNSFREDKDTLVTELCSDLLLEYEAWLKARGLSMNTVSFYMRILRAVYNRAVEKSMMEQQNPFKCVYTGIEKTRKRAISLKAIKRIKELDLRDCPQMDFARDMFLFSFYTRGMSFVDMAYLRTKDLQNGVLTYRRRKTGQRLSIKWEKCMSDIVNKYKMPSTRHYLLPIIRDMTADVRLQYKNSLAYVNRRLKEVGALTGLPVNLTMYVARHSWASIAKSKNVPISVISEGMGHDSEMTTQIYLASLDTSTVDRANNMILRLI